MRRHLAPNPVDTPSKPAAPPTFSVAISAYNAEATIRDTVDSVLAQTVAAVDIVVCDDGSTDNTRAVLETYCDSIRLLTQLNAGPSAALNAATEAAIGDFVANVDADDVLLPGYLEALGELAVAHPGLDMLASDLWIERSGVPIGRFLESGSFPVESQRTEILRRNFALWPAIRRRLWLDVDGLDVGMRYAYDWDLFVRLVLSGASVGIVDEPLWIYRQHTGSLAANRPAMLRERVTVLEKALAHPGLRDDERRVAVTLLKAGRRDALLSEAESALEAGLPDARSRALAVVVARGMGIRTRFKALGAAVAPGVARARLERAGPSLRRARWVE